jgi:hypothetical protein
MAGKNRITRSVAPKSVFESAQHVIDATVSFNQGDLLVFDDTNNLLKKPAAEAEGSTFLGIAKVTIVDGKLASPYEGTAVDAAAAISDIPGPEYGSIAKLVLKTGDSINSGDLVYLDPASGTYHVSVAGTKAIGIYQGKDIATAPAGQEIEVLLGARHPADTLRF